MRRWRVPAHFRRALRLLADGLRAQRASARGEHHADGGAHEHEDDSEATTHASSALELEAADCPTTVECCAKSIPSKCDSYCPADKPCLKHAVLPPVPPAPWISCVALVDGTCPGETNYCPHGDPAAVDFCKSQDKSGQAFCEPYHLTNKQHFGNAGCMCPFGSTYDVAKKACSASMAAVFAPMEQNIVEHQVENWPPTQSCHRIVDDNLFGERCLEQDDPEANSCEDAGYQPSTCAASGWPVCCVGRENPGATGVWWYKAGQKCADLHSAGWTFAPCGDSLLQPGLAAVWAQEGEDPPQSAAELGSTSSRPTPPCAPGQGYRGGECENTAEGDVCCTDAEYCYRSPVRVYNSCEPAGTRSIDTVLV